jgi:ferrous iron transport protein B
MFSLVEKKIRGHSMDEIPLPPLSKGEKPKNTLTLQNPFVVALSGNPNVGKSTVFNALTGLHQHTGNWPGKTVSRNEGFFTHKKASFKLVDLPGTYSLLSTSIDEEIARDFILFGKPDVTIVVVDASRLERNLNLVLQILEISPKVVVCLNLMDEARRHHLQVSTDTLSKELGVPVIPTSARQKEGLEDLMDMIYEIAKGDKIDSQNRHFAIPPELEEPLAVLVPLIQSLYPTIDNARWIALRLLDGDEKITHAVQNGTLGELRPAEQE